MSYDGERTVITGLPRRRKRAGCWTTLSGDCASNTAVRIGSGRCVRDPPLYPRQRLAPSRGVGRRATEVC